MKISEHRFNNLNVNFILIGCFFSILLLVVIFFGYSNIFVYADGNGSILYPPDSQPFGLPLKGWANQWWQWWLSLPTSQDPYETKFKKGDCFLGQGRDLVFMISPVTGEKEFNCSVTDGKGFLVPLGAGECDYGDNTVVPFTDQGMVTCASKCNNYLVASAFVDGLRVLDVAKFQPSPYHVSSWTNITFPVDNFYHAQAGDYKAFTDGKYLFIKPLPPGDHEINYKGGISATDADCNWDGNIVYHFKVNSTVLPSTFPTRP